jgi:hypothetical protein
MPINYQVKQGDCISSIAFEHGFFADTIWNHPNNKTLKEKRQDLNILLPGDLVFIPDKQIKEVSEPTNQVYKYRLKNSPARLNLVLKYYGEPLKGKTYKLDIDGTLSQGKTDAEGKVSLSIPPDAKKGKLTVGEGEKQIEYELELGKLDPINEVKGFKKRLQNLGYEVGNLDSEMSDVFKRSISLFESENELEPSGEINQNNQNKLKEIYGR